MFKNSKRSPILHSKTISKGKIESLNRQLEKVPTFWKKRFMKDERQLVITDKMPEECGGAFSQYYANGTDKQIWLNVAIPTILENIIFKAIACYSYMEYGNIRYSDTFRQICQDEEKEIKLFTTSRGTLQYDELQVFVEMFSFVIETGGNNVTKKLSSLYSYLKKWVNGEIFNVNYSQIPNYMEIGSDVLNQQLEEVKRAFLMLPVRLKQKFIREGWKIRISNERLTGNSTYGLCSSYHRKIFIRSSSPNIKLTTWHEFGHYLDYQEKLASNKLSFKKVSFSEKTKLRKIYKSEEEYNYVISSTEEYFAEVFANYINDGDMLSRVVPKSAQVVKEIITKWS